MKEIWKDIEGYEGYYQVSNLGRVKSLFRQVKHSEGNIRNNHERILKNQHDGGGYPMVGLHKNSKTKAMKVHRLVMLAFKDNPHNKPEVNHIDENKNNNRLDNLEWVTKKENENHGTKRERCKANTNYKIIAMKNSKKVRQISADGELIKEWDSLAQIYRDKGYSKGNISQACNGIYKGILYGCRWEYA